MKILSIFTAAILLTSCTTQETYELSKDESSLKWRGSITPDYFHTGSVDIISGNIMIENDVLKEGSFEIDMSTIKVEDENLPDEKKVKLVSHLKDADYFNVSGFPKVEVMVSGYTDGNLTTTIKVLGNELKRDIPVSMDKTENSVSFKGKFDIDFDDLKIPGMQPEEGSEDHVQSIVNYELNLTLKKK